jgi:hypothetical protein
MALEYDKYGCHQCVLKSECDNVSPAHKPPCSKLADKNFNSIQQLKSEIAAVVHDMEVDSKKVCGVELEYYLNRLRQLSAV